MNVLIRFCSLISYKTVNSSKTLYSFILVHWRFKDIMMNLFLMHSRNNMGYGTHVFFHISVKKWNCVNYADMKFSRTRGIKRSLGRDEKIINSFNFLSAAWPHRQMKDFLPLLCFCFTNESMHEHMFISSQTLYGGSNCFMNLILGTDHMWIWPKSVWV